MEIEDVVFLAQIILGRRDHGVVLDQRLHVLRRLMEKIPST